MIEKLKSILSDDHFFFALLVILVGIGSFGLGRLSILSTVNTTNSQVAAITMSEPTLREVSQQTPSPVPVSQLSDAKPAPISTNFVASKSGSRYHLTTCPGAKQIKEENKIYFETKLAAEAAGYTKAANCPGL